MGRFRADLFQRLNPAAKVEIPPLRERLSDLPELLQVLTGRVFESPGNKRLLERYAGLYGLPPEAPPEAVVGKARATTDSVIFRLTGAALEAVRRAKWPGNMRQLELVWTNAITFQLAEQIAAGRVGTSAVVALDGQLLSELIRGSSLGSDQGTAATPEGEPERVVIRIDPGATLNEVSRTIERQYFKELYIRGGERFDYMARRLLAGSPEKNARRVQLRFNNLGLSTRALRKLSDSD